MKTYKFRLYPNKHIATKLHETLELCRQTYNTLLGEMNRQKVVDRFALSALLPDMKRCNPALKSVYSKVLQGENDRLFSNLRSLVQTKKKGRKVGTLRFKGKGHFKTFTYNQSGFKLLATGKRCHTLHLSKIGDIAIRQHRMIEGTMKQITIKNEGSGRWFALIVTDRKENQSPQRIQNVIGLDVGLMDFVYDSKGNSIENPRHLSKHEIQLKKLQRRMAKKQKKSRNRERVKIKLARQHERIVDVRQDFLHKISYYYVAHYDAIGMEDMPMILKKDRFAKSKADASWGKFRQMISYKAEGAGKLFVPVNYKGTTQRCSQCDNYVKKELWQREHVCPFCGFACSRDYNAALNIEKLTRQKIGLERPESAPVEMEALHENVQLLSVKQDAPQLAAG